jgi:hypothetical protein
MLTFPGQGNAPQYAAGTGVTASLPKQQTQYVFDCVIEIAHAQRVTKTKHPVQTGASISDHAYIEPAEVTLSIGMSDAMDAYFSPSTWTGNQSKSVSCYQTLLALQFSRIPLTITTKLRTYYNMLIVNPAAHETYRTVAGLRAVIMFEQVFIADTTQIPNSARGQDTQTTNLGSVDPVPPTDAQVSQNMVTQNPPSTAIGSGDWASDNWNSQQSWYSMFGGK